MRKIIFKMIHKIVCAVMCMFFYLNSAAADQQITVDVSPTISKPINGQLWLDRSKYIKLSANCSELNQALSKERFNLYIKDYEIYTGRRLGLINGEVAYGKSIREDPNRPGRIDTAYMAGQLNPNNNGIDEYISAYGSRSDVVNHERMSNYPKFLKRYTLDGGKSYFPIDNDAHAELAAYLMKHKYTSFQRPTYYELVNEPHYKYWGDKRFHQLHTKTKAMFDKMNIPTEVGGPCYSVGNFFKNNFKSLRQITDFIDSTGNTLDFYSYHIYDYMQWSDADFDFVGAISSGLPQEAVIDAIATHTHNKYGEAFTFVASEHGGYITNTNNRKNALDMLADRYFPGSGFLHEMEKRSIDNFIMVNSAIANTMVFMNHPHIVKNTVPFILLDTSKWNPKYYSSLLVKENFDKNSKVLHESKLIHFYKFFKDVKGRRVKSICNDADIQQMSFVENNKMTMLFHNQSNTTGRISVKLNKAGLSIQNMTIRRVGRASDFRPYHTEKYLSSLSEIEIKGQESIAIFITFNAIVPENQIVDEIPFYSTQSGQTFKGSKNFTVNVSDVDRVQFATLRVGIGRKSTANSAKKIAVWLNGTALDASVEDCADRLTAKDYYATTKLINVDPALLKTKNIVTVKFLDGAEGGVGAVVIRAGIGDSVNQSLPWTETFNQANGTTSDGAPTGWTSSRNKGVFNVSGNRFHITGAAGQGVWKSDGIDISGVSTVDINVDVDGTGTTKEPSDYVRIYYRLDGGGEEMVGELTDDFNPTNISATIDTGNANNLRIIIRSAVSYKGEHYYWDNVSVTKATPVSDTTLQAENDTRKSNCHASSRNTGYTGNGYIDMGGQGSWFEWNNVDGRNGGKVKLTFTYALGSPAARPCKISVNGKIVGTVHFTGTGSWKTWDSKTLYNIPLNSGWNSIRVTASSGAGGPNVDKLDIEGN